MGRRLRPCTKLDVFVAKHGLTYSKVARASGVSRQHLLRIRQGVSPTLVTAKRIRLACGRLIKRRVHISEVFEV